MTVDRCTVTRTRRLALLLASVGFAVGLVQSSQVLANQPTRAKTTVYGAQVETSLSQETALSKAIGRPSNMDELIRRLLVAVQTLSSYHGAVETPNVIVMPLAEIHRRLCGGQCAIRAAYVPGEGLYIDDRLQPDLNIYHQSILFHELVHHAQVSAASHVALDECNRWRQREVEAYDLQNRFLSAVGSPTRVLNPGLPCASPGTVQTFGAQAQ